jgi:fatty-acyl-CoA synthase
MSYDFANSADVKAIESEMPIGDRWEAKTVFQQLSNTRDAHGDRPAVSFQLKSGAKDKNVTLSYGDLTDRVAQAANLFRSLGVGPDDVVAYLLPTSHETLITMLGGMTAGIVAPINPTLSPEHISALLKEVNAKVLVTMKPFPKTDVAQLAHAAAAEADCVQTIVEVDLLPHLSPPLSWIVPLIRPKVDIKHSANVIEFNAALAGQNTTLDFAERDDDPICAYFHTGGTTGMPKVSQHRHSGALYNGWLGANLLMDENDVVICPMPLFHVFAAYPAWLVIMTAGAHMVMPTPAGYRGEGVFDNFWKLVERYKGTFIITVPTAAAALMQRPVDADISSLKNAFCGSAPLPVELFNKFQETTGVSIVEGYGMTEATCLVSCNPPDGERKIGSVGLPLPYTDVRILHMDAKGNVTKECETGDTGEVCVFNPGVVVGATYTDPSKNKMLYADKKYMRTGDLGYKDSDGYLWLTGRSKDVIMRGGHNIDPAIIEEALAGHPAVAFAGAIGQPDSYAGELPCAYVELIADAEVTVEELIAHAREHVSDPAACPKYIEILDELPKTAVGKVFKPDLRRSAITRVYNAAMEAAELSARVVSVDEDKKLGLVAKISSADGAKNDDEVKAVLGKFIRPWAWAE